MIGAVIGTIVSASVGIAQAAMQAKSARRKAIYDQGVMDRKASKLIIQGQEKVMLEKQRKKRFLARQKTQTAASGVSLSSPTALSVFDDTEILSAYSIDRIEENALDASSAATQAGKLSIYSGDVKAQNAAFRGADAGIAGVIDVSRMISTMGA